MTRITIEEAFERAARAQKGGNLKTANTLYRSILKAQPNHVDANHNFGILSYSQGDFLLAVEHVEKAISMNGENEQYWHSLTEILYCLGDYEKLLNTFDKIEKEFASLPIQLKERANSIQSIEKNKAKHEVPAQVYKIFSAAFSEELFENVYKNTVVMRNFFQNPWKLIYFQGLAAAGMKDFDNAIGLFKSVIKIVPDFPEVYYNLGVSLTSVGETENARKNLDISLKYNPKFDKALQALGQLSYNSGDFKEASSYFNKALEINPKSSKLGLSLTQQAMGYYLEAIETVSTIVKNNFKLET